MLQISTTDYGDRYITDPIKSLARQFTKFGAIGFLNTALFYLLYLVFLTLIEPTPSYYIAYVLSMLFAILMNLKFTFSERATLRKVATFTGVYLLSMYAGAFILNALIDFSISPQLAGLLTIGVTIIMNFAGMKVAAKWP